VATARTSSPVTFSAASQIVAKLTLSAAEARRLGVPRRERVIADDIGTPLTLTPLRVNTQMRPISAQDVNGATTTATKDVTLRR
jgi:hypothetical protein